MGSNVKPNSGNQASSSSLGRMRMKRGYIQIATLFVACLSVAGCGSMEDRFYVQREWAKSLRELGIVPFFPPREDVYVGDVYAYGYDPQSLDLEETLLSSWFSLKKDQQACRRTLGMSPRLARLGKDLNTLIHSEYANTISAPRTPSGYDNIVGNPAWGAADNKVRAAQDALDKLQKAVSDANEKVITLTAERQKLQWAVDDAQTAITQAESVLTSGKQIPIDVSAEQAAVDRAAADVLKKTDIRVAAERALADLPSDATPLQRTAATAAVTQATRDLEDANTAKGRAESALAKKAAQPRDIAAKEQALALAKSVKLTADKALLDKSRELEIATATATKLAADSAGKIADATSKLDSAKALRKAIADAGAGLLHAQPHDEKYSIFENDKSKADILSKPDDTFGSRTNRLRLVGFPEFATASFTQGDLSALVPIEAMGLGINISRSSIDRVSVKVPAAESYALSAATLMAQYFAKPKYENDQLVWTLNQNTSLEHNIDFVEAVANRHACAIDGRPSKFVYVTIVTEVFYARALDVSLFSSNSFGLRSQLASPNTNIGAQSTTSDPSKLPSMAAASLDVDGLDSATANALLAKLQGRLGTTQTVPGGSIQIVSYGERSIGLRRVFDRPIGIGMRGIILEWDPKEKRVTNVVSGSGTVPLKTNDNSERSQ